MNIQKSFYKSSTKSPSFSAPYINIIPGSYHYSHNSFQIGPHKLSIKKRVKPMPGKPKLYLGASCNNKFIYISSLYPTGPGTFTMEYQESYFTVQLHGESRISIQSTGKSSKVKMDEWKPKPAYKQLELFNE